MNRRLIRLVSASHSFLYRATGGSVGARMRGAPILLLTTTGRTSGKARTTPIMYLADGGRYVIVASNGGSDRHPGWWLNLRRDSRATVRIGAKAHNVRARQAEAEEKARLWPLLTAMYGEYDRYQQATSRDIPVVVLQPGRDAEA
jgi:deazaflavin-dependent oxidoreductase (nitroreductase family)